MHPMHVCTRASLMCMACAWHVHAQVDEWEDEGGEMRQEAVDGGTTATVIALLDGATLVHAQVGDSLERAPRACMHPVHACTCASLTCAWHVHGMCTRRWATRRRCSAARSRRRRTTPSRR